MQKILIIEDDEGMSATMQDWLRMENYAVEAVIDGLEGLHRLKVYQYDVIIMDWGLPKLSGIEVCKEYRNRGGVAPILMLTGKTAVEEKTEGLDSGADDYLTKPFHLAELSARIRALLRRPAASYAGTTLQVGDLMLDSTAFRVVRGGDEVPMARKEFALLEFFMRHPNQVFSPEALIDRVWANDTEASPDIIRSYIKKLRKKIDTPDGESLIRNVQGVGYKFVPR